MKKDCTRSEINIFKYVYCNFLGTFFEAELTIECYKYILVCFFNTVHNYGATWLIAALKKWLRRVPCDKNVSDNFAALQSENRLASKLNNLYLCCYEFVFSFIRLADYLIVNTMHVLAANSVATLLNYLEEQLQHTPTPAQIQGTSEEMEQEEEKPEGEGIEQKVLPQFTGYDFIIYLL